MSGKIHFKTVAIHKILLFVRRFSKEMQRKGGSSTAFKSAGRARNNDDQGYDMFIFAQNWPVSNCIEWKERSSENTCTIRN